MADRERPLMKNLSDRNDFLRKIIDSAHEGMYATDGERRVILWNRTAEKITGYKSDEVIGRYCHDDILCHTDQDGNLFCKEKCPLELAMQSRCSFDSEIVYLKHKDGRRVPVKISASPLFDEEANVVGGIEVFDDVTERYEQQRLIVEKKQKLETVLNTIKEGFLFINAEGIVDLYNNALLDLLALSDDLRGREICSLPEDHPFRQAIIQTDKTYTGQHCWELIGCSDRGQCPASQASFCRCWLFSNGYTIPHKHASCIDCPSYRCMKAFLEKPKELRIGDKTLSVLSSFIEFRDKNEIWEVIVFRDVTAERLDAVMKLASAAAHELRQPLTIIVGAASLLSEELSEETRVRKYLIMLEESCYRLNDIITKIGDIAAYRIKQYTEDVSILDIEGSSHKGTEKDKLPS